MSKVAKVFLVIFGILMIIGGISCMFTPVYMTLVLGYVVGLSMVFDAVARFIYWWQEKEKGLADGWMLTGAILSAVFGFFILNSAVLQLGIDVFIVYYIACWLVLRGIFAMIQAFKMRRVHKNMDTVLVGTRWYIPLCIGILSCVFGILCLFKPVIMASVIGVFIGLGIICTGAEMITLATTPDTK